MGTLLSWRQRYCVSAKHSISIASEFNLSPFSLCERRYMVDAADLDKMEASRNELHSLLDKPQLSGIPVLVLGNKRDLPGALDETGLIERM